ncbi:MAG: HD domain-containing protein [Acidobacteriota bacterium]
MLSIRDPIHGFIRADDFESALLRSRPLQRLRFIRQLGLTFLVFPGAEHSRFSHTLGTMHLAGRLYDALVRNAPPDAFDPSPRALPRRLVRAAALLHDIGHAPFSHSAEDLFDEAIDHEAMTARLLRSDELRRIFDSHGDGVTVDAVVRVLRKEGEGVERLLSSIITSPLDVDKMDYLLRDSLYCGVQYGSFDLERLLDTLVPIDDPDRGWSVGVHMGGLHALEAMVMARYYMFTQVYFNDTGKIMELHLNEWLREVGHRWPSAPEAFLEQDDVSVWAAMRASDNPHARAIVARKRFRLAFETDEHLTPPQVEAFRALLPALRARFGEERLLVDHSSKNPHQFSETPVWVRRRDDSQVKMTEASDFIRHLSRINRFRVYAPADLREAVHAAIAAEWVG